LGGSSRENEKSSAPNENDAFFVRAAKPGLGASIPVAFTHPSFSMALSALVWGLVMPGQMCFMP